MYFRSILNFLRDQTMKLPADPVARAELIREAVYYNIEGILKICPCT